MELVLEAFESVLKCQPEEPGIADLHQGEETVVEEGTGVVLDLLVVVDLTHEARLELVDQGHTLLVVVAESVLAPVANKAALINLALQNKVTVSCSYVSFTTVTIHVLSNF